MFCTECGTKLVDGAKYCYNCGAAVQAERTVPQEPAKPQEQPVSEAQSAPEENIMTGTAAISISKRISDQAESLAAKYEEPETQPQTSEFGRVSVIIAGEIVMAPALTRISASFRS